MNIYKAYAIVVLTLIIILLLACKVIKFLHHFVAEVKKNYHFVKEFKKKNIFQLGFSEEIEILNDMYSLQYRFLSNYYVKRILLNKFLNYLKQNANNPKIISTINFGLDKIFFFENSDRFRNEVLRVILLGKEKLIYEISIFSKMDKVYVLEKFFDWFNGKSVDIAFVNKFNEILFEKATYMAYHYKKVTLLKTLDTIQIAYVHKFLAA